MLLTTTIQKIASLRAELSSHETAAKARSDAIRSEIAELSRSVALDGAMLDQEKISLARTEKAVLFHTGNKEEAAWLPLSQIEIEETGFGGIFTVSLPEWLALEKGLI